MDLEVSDTAYLSRYHSLATRRCSLNLRTNPIRTVGSRQSLPSHVAMIGLPCHLPCYAVPSVSWPAYQHAVPSTTHSMNCHPESSVLSAPPLYHQLTFVSSTVLYSCPRSRSSFALPLAQHLSLSSFTELHERARARTNPLLPKSNARPIGNSTLASSPDILSTASSFATYIPPPLRFIIPLHIVDG